MRLQGNTDGGRGRRNGRMTVPYTYVNEVEEERKRID